MSLRSVYRAEEVAVLRTRAVAKVAKAQGEEVSFTDAVPAMVQDRSTVDVGSAAVAEQVYAPVVQGAERL